MNLLPVAQQTNALANAVVDRPWVVGREFESHFHHENSFGRKVNLLMSLINRFPWVPRDSKEIRRSHVRPHTKTKNSAIQNGGRVL